MDPDEPGRQGLISGDRKRRWATRRPATETVYRKMFFYSPTQAEWDADPRGKSDNAAFRKGNQIWLNPAFNTPELRETIVRRVLNDIAEMVAG